MNEAETVRKEDVEALKLKDSKHVLMPLKCGRVLKPYIFRKREIKEFERDLGTLERVEVKDGIEITMSPEALETIMRKAQKVHDAVPSFTMPNLKVGITGQAAVFYEVKRNWLAGVRQMRIGMPDVYDMLYRGFRSEIKTFDISRRGKDFVPKSLMAVNLIKFHERPDSFYIGCLMVDYNKICIMGFVTREAIMLLDRDKVHDNYSNPYEPDANCVVVRKRCQFTHITRLDSVIDSMIAERRCNVHELIEDITLNPEVGWDTGAK